MINKTIERVRAGLLAMSEQPDQLLFIDDLVDWTWDTATCLDLEVFHATLIAVDPDCPFLPIWNEDQTYAAVETAKFRSAYIDWSPS